MLRCHIVFILWILACAIATVPLDNIKQTDNDKNFPKYLDKYLIDNKDEEEQQKIEMRPGELTSDQFYIDNNQSSSDTKYFANEWRYHPVLKYGTSNNHDMTSNTHSTYDNHPNNELFNITDNSDGITISTNTESNISSKLDSLKNFHQQISNETNTYNQSTSMINFISNINNIELLNDTESKQRDLTNSPSQYDDVIKLLETNDGANKNGSPINYSNDNLNDEVLNEAYSTITENILLKENGGMFGQRLQQNIIQQFNNTNRVNPKLSYTVVAMTNNNNNNNNNPIILPETSSHNYRSALKNLREYLKLNNEFNDNSNNGDKFKGYNNDAVNSQIELPEFSNDSKIKISNLLDETKMNFGRESLEKHTSIEPETTIQFSRPIVVAEISNMEQLNYSEIFPCNEENIKLILSSTIGTTPSSIIDQTLRSQVSSGVTSTPKFQQTHITTSSMVLNPIQAGVALVNAGKAHLIVGKVKSSLTETANKNTFNENVGIHAYQPLKNIEHDETSHLSNIPPEINPTFGNFKMSTENAEFPLIDADQTVEIQKSLELYHSSPVQEIHYPAQLMPQVTSIDQQQRQEPYQTTQKHENAKQTFERNVESYEMDIDLTSRNTNTLRYQSIVNPSALPLQELQAPPVGDDPTRIYITDIEQKLDSNNVEHFKRPVENYVFQDNHSSFSTLHETPIENENLFINERLNSELYSPHESKNLYRIIEPNESRDIINDKLMKQTTSIITMEEQPREQSILHRLLTESSDIVQYLELDKLNNRDKNIHQRHPSSVNKLGITSQPDYTKTQINLIQQPIPIFTNQQYSDPTNIVTNVETNKKLLSHIDNDTVYIYTPNINSKINNLKNYGNSLNNPIESFIGKSVDEESGMRPSPYTAATNKFVKKPVPFALQPYPISAAETIINKKIVPYPIHKLVAQPYPIHIVPPYTMEKSTNIPAITYQNIIAKNTPIPHEYPSNIPIKISYPVELIKHTQEKTIEVPYSMQYGLNYQNIINQQIKKVHDKSELLNSFDLPIPTNTSNKNTQSYINLPLVLNQPYNSLKHFTNNKKSLNYQPPSKKSYLSQMPSQTYITTNVNHPTPLRWHVTHRPDEKFMKKNMGYLGSISLVQHPSNDNQKNRVVHPAHQEMFRYSTGTPVATGSSLRKIRLPETHYHSNIGNFRQSKMEYGFKPPMIPSIQYDEQTAEKIEN